MRALMTLAVINAAVWIAFVVIFPGTHLAWPGSYKFWWFDDVPWAVLLVAVAAPVIWAVSPLRATEGLKRGLVLLLIITLLAVVPYAACSGGGV